jgi:catechol 2,3-dioxygenase-like lactoylglutathione lyase family enzyme
MEVRASRGRIHPVPDSLGGYGRTAIPSRIVRAARVNHVSIPANDLEESARFYEELFGMERLPTARFDQPVLWLKLGEQQLHLFAREGHTPTLSQHFGMDVDDFDAFYAKAKAMGVLDTRSFGASMRSHPSGWVQVYLRDPAGNLLEVDWPDETTLAPETRADVAPLGTPQEGDAATATLYHSTA